MNNKKVLIAASLGIFLCMLDTTIMNITLPAIQESMKVELKDLSWALNVYTIIFASLTIPLAKFSELWGKEKAFVSSLVLFMVASLFCGLSSNLPLLILSRLLQGIAASILFPLSMIIGVSNTPIDQRDKIIAVLGVTQGFAAAIGPTLGGVISQFFSWHWVFWMNIPVVLVALSLAVTGLEFKSLPNSKLLNSIDYLGSILSMISLFLITTYLIQGSTWGWLATKELILLSSAVLIFLFFILHEKRTANPMIPLEIFRNRTFSATTIVVILSNIFLIGMMVILPSMFTTVFGFSELKAALLITPISMMIFVFSPISALLVKRAGPRLLIGLGFIILSMGYLMISFIDRESYLFIIIVCTLVGVGYGIIIGPATLLAASDFTGEMLTASQSIIGVVRQIGIVIGVALFVTLLTSNLNDASSNIKAEYQSVINDSQNLSVANNELRELKTYLENNYSTDMSVREFVTEYREKSDVNNGKENPLLLKIDEVITNVVEMIKTEYLNVYATMAPFALIAILFCFLFPSKKVIWRNN